MVEMSESDRLLALMGLLGPAADASAGGVVQTQTVANLRRREERLFATRVSSGAAVSR